MVFLPDDANDVDGLTLELCDNNWYNDATAITENRRAFLKESHFVSVANLIDSKMKDSPKDTVEKKNIYSTAAPGGLRSTTGHTSVVNRSATDDNNIGDPTSRLSCTSSSSESVAVANGGDVAATDAATTAAVVTALSTCDGIPMGNRPTSSHEDV